MRKVKGEGGGEGGGLEEPPLESGGCSRRVEAALVSRGRPRSL